MSLADDTFERAIAAFRAALGPYSAIDDHDLDQALRAAFMAVAQSRPMRRRFSTSRSKGRDFIEIVV